MEIRRYDEKIAVVTGAANGIGLSMVKRLVEEGAKVAALDIDTETIEKEYAGQEEDSLSAPLRSGIPSTVR